MEILSPLSHNFNKCPSSQNLIINSNQVRLSSENSEGYEIIKNEIHDALGGTIYQDDIAK